MDLEQLKQILDLVRQHELSEFEIEQGGLRLKIRKDAAGGLVPHLVPAAPSAAALPAASPAASPTVPPGPPLSADAAAPVDARDEDTEQVVVKSPIVGTFYRSSEPSSPPFVEIGSMVKKGQVLCIIEAMKLMNEIDSEYDGEVVNIFIENGQPVQYGERMFAIRTK
jgi:acetyl-CoA carboxylase biotin carboxyl carrier protein